MRADLTGPGGSSRAVAFSPVRADRLFSADADGAARVWDWNGPAPAADPRPTDPRPDPDAADPKNPAGEVVAGTATVTESLLALADPRDGHDGGLTALALSPDGLAVWTGGEDGRVIRWDAGPPPGSPAPAPDAVAAAE